jgi:hypothetical protein
VDERAEGLDGEDAAGIGVLSEQRAVDFGGAPKGTRSD